MSTLSYKVLHGFGPSAGQPAMMASALRSIGVDASNVVMGYNKFGYPSDYTIPDAGLVDKCRVLGGLGAEADVVHIHAITPFFNKGMPKFPMGMDLLALKAAGKRVVVHFRGSEIRMASLFAANNPYHYVDDDPERLIAKFSEENQVAYLSMCQALADELVVSDPELATYVPGASVIPRIIDFNTWKYVGPSNARRPLIVHAPSRRGVKGTEHVINAVEALKGEGLDFDFTLVENLSQTEARAIFEKCDVIVDQLRIGWYGVLAVEAMALGKTVVSYIRDDIVATLGEEPPIAVANPDTIKDVLRDLINSPELRQRIAENGYKYCCATHDPQVVAQQCKVMYERVLAKPHSIDLPAYMAFCEQQVSAGGKIKATKAIIHNSQDAIRGSFWREVYYFYKRVGLRRFVRRVLEKVGAV
ncbi:glycosyltransferase [Pseudomonas putida]|uniref:glycosyltransferase family protein n=1 Tax=Pseudomonas putida TaxID=303 RepID=UPI00345D5C33|nr:glycosyltransferase family 4 protein [Pseudomonas putida]